MAQKKPFKTKAQSFRAGAGGRVNVSKTGQSVRTLRQGLTVTAKRKLFDEMFRDPTVSLAVDVIVAMMMQQPWSIEGPDKRINDYTTAQLLAYKKRYIKSAFRGHLKDGWRTFETRFGLAQHKELGLRQTLEGVKALRGERTDILVEEDTGDIIGLVNSGVSGDEVVIDRDHMVLANMDEDGFGELGDPLFKRVEKAYTKHEMCDKGAQRYDEKVAGGFLWIKYPVGSTSYSENGGEETDNSEIAAALGERFRAAGWGATPVNVDEDGDGNQGLQPGFITRLKYLDALKLRALGLPERSATEGTFGTKAEAEAHADIAILVNTDRHDSYIDPLNTYLLEPFNRSNWGDPGACRLVLGRLDPNDRQLFQTIFTALMADPMLGHDVAQRVDIEQLLEKLSVPIRVPEPFAPAAQNV